MKLLVIGATGQVGWELQRSLQPLGSVVAADRSMIDLADPSGIIASLEKIAPDVIINAGAYTAVDKAEGDEAMALCVNAQSPGLMAEYAKRVGALLIHYSTDYVFDGTKSEPYVETDPPCPVNAYGRTKLAGEQAIAQKGGDWLVFRTTWVYASRGNNFARTMLRLARERDRLSVVNDQFGAPTSARFLADATAQVVTRSLLERAAGRFESGLFHLTAAGHTTWHGLASALIEGAKARGESLKVSELTGIPASQYPTPAKRPVNSRLALAKVEQRFGISPPQWRAGVELVLGELFPG